MDFNCSVFVNNKAFLCSRCDSVFGLVRFNMACDTADDAFDFKADTDFVHTSENGEVRVLSKEDVRYVTARCIDKNKFIVDVELKKE